MAQAACIDKTLVCLIHLVTLLDFMESFDFNEPLKWIQNLTVLNIRIISLQQPAVI